MLRIFNDFLPTKQPPKLLDQVSTAIRTIQELLGHEDLNTKMIYAHVTNKGGLGVLSAQPCGSIVRTSA